MWCARGWPGAASTIKKMVIPMMTDSVGALGVCFFCAGHFPRPLTSENLLSPSATKASNCSPPPPCPLQSEHQSAYHPPPHLLLRKHAMSHLPRQTWRLHPQHLATSKDSSILSSWPAAVGALCRRVFSPAPIPTRVSVMGVFNDAEPGKLPRPQSSFRGWPPPLAAGPSSLRPPLPSLACSHLVGAGTSPSPPTHTGTGVQK